MNPPIPTDIQGDPSIERTWVEPTVEEVAVLSSGPAYTLYNPAEVDIGRDGRIYVFDGGEYHVEGFTRDGRYVQTYGRGEGQGPGEVLSITDLGVWRDSILYVLDAEQRHVNLYRRGSGAFIRVEQYQRALFRLHWTRDSTEYAAALTPASPFLRVTLPSGRRRTVSTVTSLNVASLALDGRLHSFQGRAVYVPYYFPVVLTYSPTDTVGRAFPTPDYGSAPVPKSRTDTQGDTRIRYPPSDKVNDSSSLHEGILAVQRPNADRLEFDLYDATDAMRYLHTLRFPLENGTAAFGNGRLIVARDTTVHVYRVERPTK